MGLTDFIKNLAGSDSHVPGLVDCIHGFLCQGGGFAELKTKFEKEGAGHIFESWISEGNNLPISGEQLHKVMGSDFIHQCASKIGVDPSVAANKLAETLPHLIDHLSPNGKLSQLPDRQSLCDSVTQMIDKMRRSA
jgi:uncharacterized protein YidB (DUF937 family)